MIEPYVLVFGPFELRFPQRTLTRDHDEIRLGSRAVDILVTLAHAAGELVSNRELVAKVWPDSVVDEGSLRVHMSALRKALEDGRDGIRYIANETGRGYRLAVSVEKRSIGLEGGAAELVATSPWRSHLPGLLGRILGREPVIAGLCDTLPKRRLMTISGAGGIGKTTVALGIAHRFEAERAIQAYFVDLAPIIDPSRVGSAVALALGVAVTNEDPVPDLVSAIGHKPLLLLLDNCEHLVDAVARLVDRLLRGASGLHCLVTSREPLRTEDEWVHRLAPLPVPVDSLTLDARQALSFPSIALFVERACAANHTFEFTDSQVVAVSEICRRLDGIPLAIEMAAARVASMDVQMLAGHLADRFSVLTSGRRTALPRQQTLRAMLDWSYMLLEPVTQKILQRLSLFRSAFDIAAAVAVASNGEIDDMAVFDATQDLVSKSLLVSDQGGGATTYRLLETTRHYALSKLSDVDIQGEARRAHAQYFCDLFADLAPAWEGSVRRESTVHHSKYLGDVSAASDWAASPEGDPALAVQLAASTSPLWFQLSLPYEFMKLAESAIAAIARANLKGSVQQVELLTAYGHAIWHTSGPVQAMADAFEASLEIAMALGDIEIQMRCVWGVWSKNLQSGEYPKSLEVAEMYRDLADKSSQFGAGQTSRHTRALSHERLGQLGIARKLIDDVLEADRRNPDRQGHANAAQVNGRIAGWTLHMRLLWLEGYGLSALAVAREAVDELRAVGHDLSACFCLTMGVLPVALWVGDMSFARETLAILRGLTKKKGLTFWDKWADGYEALINKTPFDTRGATVYQMEIFATLGCPNSLEVFADMRRSSLSTWCQAELLRREALMSGASDVGIESAIKRAMAVAKEQGATSWRLRAAVDLAHLMDKRGNVNGARALLSELRESFPDGFETPTMRDAETMMSSEQPC